MTDEQWVNLTAWLKLPPEARAPIENELDLYARVSWSARSGSSWSLSMMMGTSGLIWVFGARPVNNDGGRNAVVD